MFSFFFSSSFLIFILQFNSSTILLLASFHFTGIVLRTMAQLLSPLYGEALKIHHNPSLNPCSRSSWRMLAKAAASPCSFVTQSGKRRRGCGVGRLRVAAEDSVSPTDTAAAADDYYAVLGLVMHQTLISLCSLHSEIFTHTQKGLYEMQESNSIKHVLLKVSSFH